MLFSYQWLKELSGTKRTPEKLSELLMAHAFEVESVEPYAHGLAHVVIGKVLSVKQHPNADRLRVAQVSVGKGDTREIVCGAPNLAKGQRVAVALPGATLPGGIVIKESELRGVMSHGMICSSKELGLGADHTGIRVLPDAAPVGKAFAQYAGLDDVVMDIKILPDRSSDALSYQGLAREIAALEGSEAPFLESLPVKHALKKGSRAPKIMLKTERCRRYIAVHLAELRPSETPLRAEARLLLSGLRPISPVVDLTNYLMLETGQPIHAFDAAHIGKGGIVVRDAKPKEELVLLDETALSLTPDDIVIADTKKPLALAGVMGGKHSGMSTGATSAIFELAHFDAKSIRRTEKRYRLQTDAAYRFERGIDLARPSEVTALLAVRVAEWGLGSGLSYREAGVKLPKPKVITLELETVSKLLGAKVPLFEVVQYCSWLGLSVKKLPNRAALAVTVPLRRPDLNWPEDLVEEIGRMRGYDAIEPKPLALPAQPLVLEPTKVHERQVKSALIGLGFDEVMTYSFYGERSIPISGSALSEHLALANPVNPDQAFLRTSLFPNLLRAMLGNAKQFARADIFEYGSVYRRGAGQPEEEKRLGLLSYVAEAESPEAAWLLFKARLESLFEQGGVRVTFEVPAANVPQPFHPTRAARLAVDGDAFGWAGVVESVSPGRLGKRALLMYAELSTRVWIAHQREEHAYRPIPRFPLAERDISLVGSRDVMFDRLQRVIHEAGAPLIQKSELFDVYTTGEEKSFALHLGFGSEERTLSGGEMDAAFDRIVAAAEEHLGMRLKL